MSKKIIMLEGLNCANCAAKIEDKVKNIGGVKNVNLNFIEKTLTLETEDREKVTQIKDIINKIEPDVEIYEKNGDISEEHRNNYLKDIIKFTSGITFFVLAIMIKNNFYISLIFYIAAYFIFGFRVLKTSFKNILRGNIFDENFLMMIATVGAFAIKEFPEAVGVMLFYEIGEFFQDIAVDNSRKSIKSLLNIRPDYANIKKDNKYIKIKPEEIKKGDIIYVKPGERIPVDGIIISGKSFTDNSALTGESLPVSVKEGDLVLSGSINQKGLIEVRTEKIFSESTVAKILDLVENATSKKAKTEKFITKFAKYYTPVVVFFAIALFIIPVVFFSGNFNEWLYRALIFLVISCPCAIVVSVPLGYFAGIGKLSKNGVMVKGGNYIEVLKDLDTIIFDKTGTLTYGVFEVNKINAFNGFKEEEILEYAAYSEFNSNHPIAESIRKKYGKVIDSTKIKEFSEFSGYGTEAIIDHNTILAGNEKLLSRNSVKFEKNESFSTVVYISVNNIFAGTIEISDIIKNNTAETIKKLKKSGIKNTVMLTGDNEKTAHFVAEETGIDKYYSQLLPDEKLKKFEHERGNRKTAFIGDGINDAPVLTYADVGIAMGGLGSDAAIEAADVIIMDDDISKIEKTIKISKRTSGIIWQNIIFVLSVKIIFLILGALGIANMWEAVFADVGIALIAVFNTLRIFRD